MTISDIRKRAEAATLGPWVPCERDDSYIDGPDMKPEWGGHYHLFWDGEGLGLSWLASADEDFIAHAREDIPFLLAALAEAEAAVVTARERAEVLEAAVRALPGAAWNSFDGDGKRLDWLVERSAVLALLTRADQ